MIAIVIIGIIISFVVNYIVASQMETAAALKGYGKEVHVFAMCFWLGIIGCIYVAALPDLIQQKQTKQMIDLWERNRNENT